MGRRAARVLRPRLPRLSGSAAQPKFSLAPGGICLPRCDGHYRPACGEILYILLVCTTPSSPRCNGAHSAAAASTEETFARREEGRNRTFVSPAASSCKRECCAPSPTKTRPTPSFSNSAGCGQQRIPRPGASRFPACSSTKRKSPAWSSITSRSNVASAMACSQPRRLWDATFDREVIQAIRGDFRFVLLHAGNLGFYGAWDTLLTAARELENDGVGLVFVGDGAQRSRLQELAAGNIERSISSLLPGDKVSSVLAAADAHVITIKRGLEGVVVPSKMYGILAAGRPIVAVAPGETDAAILGARENFGCAADPDRPEEVVAVVRALLADPSRVAAMGAAARSAAPRYARSAEIRSSPRSSKPQRNNRFHCPSRNAVPIRVPPFTVSRESQTFPIPHALDRVW